MLIFRLLSFALRIVGSFFFVFLLQIQFDGKTLESYLNDFGRKFIVTRTLKKVSQDGASAIRSFSPSSQKKIEAREPSSSTAIQYAKDLAKKFTLPATDEKDSSKEKPLK